MAIINNLDTGMFSTNQGPSSGLEGGADFIEGLGSVQYARGGKALARSTTINVQAPFAIGSAAAGSRQAVRYAVQQLVELANNPDMSPVYIQWESGHGNIIPNPFDGWYRIDEFTPLDFTFNTFVPCQISATRVAPPAPNPLAFAYAGGALATNASGASQKILSYPPNATVVDYGVYGGTRQGADGSCVFQQPQASPSPFVPSPTKADWFRGGSRVYDTIATSAFGVPAGASIQTLFRSLGNDATGTLNAWSTISGCTIAANIVTIATSGQMSAGHPDWDTGTVTARIQWSTSSAPCLIWRNVLFYVNGANLFAAVGFSDAGAASVAAALVNGTQYWLRGQIIGNTAIASIYADSAGAIGALIATVSTPLTGHSSPASARSVVTLTEVGGVAGFHAGGAFANVFTFTGPTPSGWVPIAFGGWTTVEPAFCWSQNSPYRGTFALSVYLNTTGLGYWTHTGLTTLATSYTFGGSIRGVAMSGVGADILLANAASATLVLAGSPAWTVRTITVTATAGASELQCRFQGPGTAYFDDVSVWQGSAAIYGDGFEPDVNAMWVEVFSPDHDFAGDCVISNGFQLMLFQALGTTLLYLWNTALAVATWQNWGSLKFIDSAIATVSLYSPISYSLQRVGLEECAIVASYPATSGAIGQYLLRLQRGRYEIRLDYTSLSDSGAGAGGPIIYNNGYSGPKIVFNPAAVKDNANPPNEGSIATLATDYLYAGAFLADATKPFLYGFLYQNKPNTFMPQAFGAANGDISAGDAGVTPGTRRAYGLWAIPYGVFQSYSTADLQQEMEQGGFGAGWSIVNPDAAASNSQSLKAASGTGSGVAATAGHGGNNVFSVAAGTYDIWVRVKVTSAAGAGNEMSLGIRDFTSAIDTLTTYKPNQLATSYGWVRAVTDYAPNATHAFQFKALTAGVLGTDWFVDEFVMVPKTLSADSRGPRDIWQQFMYDRDVVLVAN